jgi:hypothetical protein
LTSSGLVYLAEGTPTYRTNQGPNRDRHQRPKPSLADSEGSLTRVSDLLSLKHNKRLHNLMHDASVAQILPKQLRFCSVITAWSVERIERPNRSLESPKIIAKFGRIPLAICGSIDASLTALEQILTDLSWAR